ncbi:MAG: substrate-binding domain-containing protein [Spirochaetes bacterium]|nr:substrate-binding domain-containing protein [Spirochaetota bacterium]
MKIAVINGYDTWSHSLPNGYWVKILSGIHDIALMEQVHVACIDMYDMEKMSGDFRAFDGCIGAIPGGSDIFAAVWRQVRAERPCIAIMSCTADDEPYVGPDEVSTVRKIVDHLADEGHRSCFFATLSTEQFSDTRRDAFIRFASGKKIGVTVHEYAHLYRVHGAYAPDRAAEDLLAHCRKHRPHTIVFESDFFASRFERAAAAAGVRVPDDIGIIGMNDSPEYPIPVPLTTTRHDGVTIGREAARLLLARIRGERTVKRVLVDSALVIRRSSLRRTLYGGHVSDFRHFVEMYVRTNYAYPEMLRELPKTLGMTPSQFSRTFKNAFRVGFVAYVNRHRIGQAEYLLRDTAESVTTIAMNTGFNNHTNFMTFFRREHGCTPSEFRLKHAGRRKQK